jgi:hypothetical protein
MWIPVLEYWYNDTDRAELQYSEKACPISLIHHKATRIGLIMNQSSLVRNLWLSSWDLARANDVSGLFNEKIRDNERTQNFRKKKHTRKWQIWRSVRGWADKNTVYILELRCVVPISGSSEHKFRNLGLPKRRFWENKALNNDTICRPIQYFRYKSVWF